MSDVVRREFEVHLLNSTGIGHARELAHRFSDFLNFVESICGSDGREMALVRTKMEEACFFAKKAMASRPEYQQQ